MDCLWYEPLTSGCTARERHYVHGEGGLLQPAEEARGEVDEGKVDGPGQQGWQAPTVQGDLR